MHHRATGACNCGSSCSSRAFCSVGRQPAVCSRASRGLRSSSSSSSSGSGSARHHHSLAAPCWHRVLFTSSIAAASAAPAPSTLSPAAAAAAAAGTATGAPAETPADACLQLAGLPAKAVGALVGAMCGNALGAQVEPEKCYRLSRLFPDGMSDMSFSFDLSPEPLPAGHVTGDFIACVMAVGRSVCRRGSADALDIAAHLAAVYQPGSPARYNPYTGLALEGLAAGTNPFMLAAHTEAFMQVTPSRVSQSCSHRPDRAMHGTTDFTAVLRAVPVALAYRDTSPEMLTQAVDAAVVFTHPTEKGREGAQTVAAAIAWLLRSDPAEATPEALLEHLLAATESPDMSSKLQLLQQALPELQDLGHITSWRSFWASAEWAALVGTANRLWKQNLAIEGTQAAALALWVQLASWRHPQQAVMLAASLGGYAATTAALTGALAGALHGSAWLPVCWWQQLQDDEEAPEDEAAADAAQNAEAAAGGAETGAATAAQGAGAAAEVEAEAETAAVPEAAAEGRWDAAAAAADGYEGEESDVLRVGKYAVVLLGHELAALQP